MDEKFFSIKILFFLLFDIKKVIFGPKCSKKNLKNAISEALDKNIDITASEIIGYR